MQLVLMLGALGLLGACSDKAASDDTATPGEGEGEGEGEGDNGLPDLLASLDTDTEGCEERTDSDGVVHQVAGAVSYFYGVYNDNGDGTWDGEEYWLLYANPEWVANGGADCQIYWVASGTDGDPGACPTCDVGLDVNLQVDKTLSDCPEELYEGFESSTVAYAVRHTSDTEATWYYASSGNELGAGYYNSGAMNFVTDRACKWF